MKFMVSFKLAWLFDLLLIALSSKFINVTAIIPDDIEPLNVYDAKDTSSYPVFLGTVKKRLSAVHPPKLHSVQGMDKLDNSFYIYGRNHIFVLDLAAETLRNNEIPYTQVVEWVSSDGAIKLCTQFGQTKEKCKNFVKVFEKDTNKPNNVILCGTNAYKPVCRYYELSKDGSITYTNEEFRGELLCPCDPTKKVASLVSDGSLYTGTVKGITGQDALIHRRLLTETGHKNLRTSRGDTNMLNYPTFLRFIDGGKTLNKVYAFFTETALEDKSYEIYSRLGQACKNDEGGMNLLRNQFTSFFKVRLNCSLPGHPPFYFNEMRDVTDLTTLNTWYKVGNTKMVFSIMTTPRNSIPASAICAFTLDDIETSLGGNFKEEFRRESSRETYWGEQQSYPDPHLASCQTDPRTLSDSNLNFARKHPFMHDDVPAWNLVDNITTGHRAMPIFSRTRSRDFLTTLVVDTTAGTLSLYTVIIAGSESGKIVKVVLLQDGSKAVVEERLIFNPEKCGDSNRSVKKIVLDKKNGVMAVAFENCVIRAPLCPLSTTCGRDCIKSRDPYCGWDGDKCVMLDQVYVSKNKTAGRFQPRQDVIHGNVDGMPDCEVIVKVPESDKSVLPLATSPSPRSDNGQANGTGAVAKGGPLVGGTVPTVGAAGSSYLIYGVIGAIGLVIGIMIGLATCHVLRHRCLEPKSVEGMTKEELKALQAKENRPNGHIVNGRRGSSNSNARKSRHESSSSHNQSRNSNPASATHDDTVKRNRTITENSNRSDTGEVFVPTSELHTPDTPSARGFPENGSRIKQSTSSSVGGRRKARNSKPSTSSANDKEEMQGIPENRGYAPYDDAAFVNEGELLREGSNDSGNGSEGLVTSLESEPLMTVAPSQGKPPRAAPARSMSFGGHHQQHIPRTYSVDNNGASTMGHARPPHGRGINRQLSLQPTDVMARQMMYSQQAQQRGYTLQGPPPTMPPNWMNQPPAPVNVTPNTNFDNRRMSDMTHSLDRRRKPKGQPNYQIGFSESFDETKPLGATISTTPRKRYVSESEKAARMPVHHPTPCQAIREEQEPHLTNHLQERPQRDPNDRRNNLSLKLATTYPGVANTQGSHSAPIMEPGMALPNQKRLPGRMVTHSNPGTPLRDHPGNFTGNPMASPMGPMSAGMGPVQKNQFVPSQRSLPEEMQQRLVLSHESPTKSNPSSPMQDGRPPSFPGMERIRHSSGPNNAMQRSPLRTTAPISFGSPSQNPQYTNVQRTRQPSGGTSRNQNGPVVNDYHMQVQPHNISPNTPPIMQTTTFA